LTEAAFDASFAVNLKSAWFAAKHALAFMREQGQGSIVSISSVASIQAYPYLGYKTMKAALNAMTENMAAANARHGIRINAILPGLMNTPMAIENRVAKGHRREDVVADRDRRIPLKGKQGTGWDVANAALFLHSDEASFITGVTLVVDGGETISHGH
jgi:NAD(P)-dependent dehydrogenase (short-subunit alcohol dehydrogenase family)